MCEQSTQPSVCAALSCVSRAHNLFPIMNKRSCDTRKDYNVSYVDQVGVIVPAKTHKLGRPGGFTSQRTTNDLHKWKGNSISMCKNHERNDTIKIVRKHLLFSAKFVATYTTQQDFASSCSSIQADIPLLLSTTKISPN